jgi:CubicO group peptidase (beta-lactamase class C family)
MARLYEQGSLDLDMDIHKFLPDFPLAETIITCRQLASHRSGVRGYRNDLEAMEKKYYKNVSESLNMFKDDPLAFRPGSDFLYSGYGYVLLSAVLEKSGKGEFPALLKSYVFNPLAMNNSYLAGTGSGTLNEATGYDVVTPYSTDGSMVKSPPIDFSFKWAAGGILSTPMDLIRFANAHIKSLKLGFLDTSTIKMLFRPETYHLIAGYGLGWLTAIDPGFRKVHFNFGAGSGGTSVVAIYPDQEFSMVILTNLGHAKFPMKSLLSIAGIFLCSPVNVIFNFWLIILIIWVIYKVWNKYHPIVRL